MQTNIARAVMRSGYITKNMSRGASAIPLQIEGHSTIRNNPFKNSNMNYTSTTDVLGQVIEQAVESAIRRALNVNEATKRRLLSVEEAAVYLSLSKREIYNMIASDQLRVVTRGRRKMLDIRDLDEWIERNKV
jgi:excisionase family DNA binding protein